jgi:hypothetical protein
MKYKLYTFYMFLGLMLVSCGKGKTNETPKNDQDSLAQVTSQAPKTVLLKCVSKGMDEFENPQNNVVLSIDGKDSVLTNILACEDITKADYERLGIPKEATTACGGWWAGAGEYFYAYIKDAQVHVFYGWQAEEQEDEGFHYKELNLKSAKFEHFN